ncbi:MAG: hypothetical protein VB102_11150 [Paludibacter sp.]|nr:hypothetical protein [Paludibacter sp.]
MSQHDIKETFLNTRPKASFNTAVNYLFDSLLNILSQLRTNQDNFFTLTNLLMNAKVLYEKSIYQECFNLLIKVQEEAVKYENFTILLIAQKLELDYLLSLNFPNISEQELLSKRYKINDTLKKIRKINEHASLYELLKHRILHKGTARSSKHIQEFNDLVVSEMSIVSSSGFDNFEIQKNHKLFQSGYLINVGDYNSALTSFYELNNIFEQNKHLLSNPPIYYLMTIEGVLESLRNIRNYEGMEYFIDQLNNIQSSSSHFIIQVKCVVFLYRLFPLIDRGYFAEAKKIVDDYKNELYDKISLLIPDRQVQLCLYTALVYLGLKEFVKARKMISQIISGEKKFFSVPLLRTLRLVNLMVLYEQNEFDYIEFEVRSIKREIQNKEQIYQIELMMLKLLNNPLSNLSIKERNARWRKIEPKLAEFRNNKFELQLLRVYDFTAWIESKIKNIPLDMILREKN